MHSYRNLPVRPFNGNYLTRIEANAINQAEAMEQFKFAFPSSCNQTSTFEVGIITAPILKENTQYKKLMDYVKLSQQRSTNNSITLYRYNYISMENTDLNLMRFIEQNLFLYNLSAGFYTDNFKVSSSNHIPDEISSRVNVLSSIIIFNNQQDEIQQICDVIAQLTAPNPPPVIFIASAIFNNIVPANLNANIVEFLKYSNIINNSNVKEWWQDFRLCLDQLAMMANNKIPHVNAEVSEPEVNTTTQEEPQQAHRCSVM